ncbi:MAG: glycoside hydrolase family 2 protein [Firmicutes bacterium]|nr:glycoside hydrolase family 2 protein [Bacillota bacterium]
MYSLSLNGNWEMKKKGDIEVLPATVPGSVYNDLLNNGLIDDPFFRDNEYKALKISCHDFEYTRTFIISDKIIKSNRVYLLCMGLDTLCEIYINDLHISNTSNMHRTYEFDIKQYIKTGENRIKIVFNSPVNYVTHMDDIDHLVSSSCAVRGISHIRKASCMFGWDWGPKLPDMGIWRDISIIYGNSGRISDMYVRSHSDNGKYILDIELENDIFSENCDFENKITVTDDEGNSFLTNSKSDFASLTIENPKIWWPNGYGSQPLYTVKNELYINGAIADCKTLTIGLREIKVNRDTVCDGTKFEFSVNGISIFAMGADYIIEDNILARCNKEKTEQLILDCIDANYNIIRVWGGGIYPEDYFFDLCDKYGLLVWQDFMFANAMYNYDKKFLDNIENEIRDNVKRLRHHACLAIWCGNNEIEELWDGRWKKKDMGTPKLKADYIKIFEAFLPNLAEKYDPDRFYWQSSPSSTGSFDNPSSEQHGDMHYWGVWHADEPFTAFRDLYPRLMTEFGLQSFPDYKTIKSFTLPEDRNIFSYVMEAHQKSLTGNTKIMNYIGMLYKYPKNLEALVYVSQLIQAEGIKYGVEHWRRNRGRCMGALYWQLNDCWPVASWSSIDSFGRWKALHYIAKRFYSPIMISACEDNTKVSLWLCNETLDTVCGKVVWRLIKGNEELLSGEIFTEIKPLSSAKTYDFDFLEQLATDDELRSTVLEYRFIVESNVISEGTQCFVKYKHFTFLNPNIKTKVFEEDGKLNITVSVDNFAKFVRLDLSETDCVFSDNYFDLTGGETKTVYIKRADKNVDIETLNKQLTVTSLFDTY